MRERFPALLLLAAAGILHAQTPRPITLQEAEQIAIRQHPRIQSARYSVAASEQMITQVHSAVYPSFAANLTGVGANDNSRIGAGALNNPIIYSRMGSGMAASQLITDFGRTGNLTERSRLNAKAEGQRAESTKEDVLLEVDQAYFAALRARAVLTVAEQTVKARQLVADQVAALAQSKLKSGLDVSFANVNLSEAKLLQVRAQNGYQAALAELAAALGYQTPEALEPRDEPLPGPLQPDAEPLVNTALQDRPEMRRYAFLEDAAHKFTAAEADLWRPSISAVTTFGLIPADPNDKLASRYAAAGLNINFPIFNGHLFSARRREAEFREKATQQDYRDMATRISRQVRVAWLDASTAQQRLSLAAQLLDQANQALDLAQARYNIGLSSIVELSQAQLNQTSAEIESVTAKYDYQIQRSVLDYSTGALR